MPGRKFQINIFSLLFKISGFLKNMPITEELGCAHPGSQQNSGLTKTAAVSLYKQLVSKGRYQDAFGTLQGCLNPNSQKVFKCLTAALKLQNANQTDKSLTLYKQAMENKLNCWPAVLNYGFALLNTQRYSQAKILWESSLLLAENRRVREAYQLYIHGQSQSCSPVANFNKAIALTKSGRYIQAAKIFNQLGGKAGLPDKLKLNVWLNLVTCHQSLKDYQSAMAYLRAILAVRPHLISNKWIIRKELELGMQIDSRQQSNSAKHRRSKSASSISKLFYEDSILGSKLLKKAVDQARLKTRGRPRSEFKPKINKPRPQRNTQQYSAAFNRNYKQKELVRKTIKSSDKNKSIRGSQPSAKNNKQLSFGLLTQQNQDISKCLSIKEQESKSIFRPPKRMQKKTVRHAAQQADKGVDPQQDLSKAENQKKQQRTSLHKLLPCQKFREKVKIIIDSQKAFRQLKQQIVISQNELRAKVASRQEISDLANSLQAKFLQSESSLLQAAITTFKDSLQQNNYYSCLKLIQHNPKAALQSLNAYFKKTEHRGLYALPIAFCLQKLSQSKHVQVFLKSLLDPARAESYSLLGWYQSTMGKIKQSAANLEKSLSIKHDRSVAFLLAQSYLYMPGEQHCQLALDILEKLENKSAEQLLVQAKCYERQGDRTHAITVLRKALRLSNGHPVLYHQLARLYQKEGDFEQSLNLDNKALEKDPQFYPALENMALFLLSQGDGMGAAGIAIRLVERYPQSEKALRVLLKCYENRGDRERQADVLRRLLRIDPDNYNYLLRLGRLMIEQEPAEGKRLLKRCVQLREWDLEARGDLADFKLLHEKKPSRALQLYQQMLQFGMSDQQQNRVKIKMARCYSELGLANDALTLLESLNSAQSKEEQFRLLLQLGQMQKALGVYEDGLSKSRDELIHYNVSKLYRDDGSLNLSIVALKKALLIRPQFGKAHLNLALSYLAVRDHDSGVHHFVRGLECGERPTDSVLSVVSHLKREREDGCLDIVLKAVSEHYQKEFCSTLRQHLGAI